jgi:acyl dehydratase
MPIERRYAALSVGDSATLARTITDADGMLGAGLISAVIGTDLPGINCIYLGQELKFLAPVFIGDTLTARVEITKLRDDKKIVTLATTVSNQRGERVIEGQAVVKKHEP